MTCFKALTIVACLMLPAAAPAEPVCMARAEYTAALIDLYGERLTYRDDVTGTQLWVSERTGTWTLAVEHPDGRMCTIETGTGFDRTVTAQDGSAVPSG